jgi:hypothetical protein
MLRVVLVLAALSALLAATPAGATGRRVPHGWLGVTADGPVRASDDREWDGMATAGAESVRASFRWSDLQPYRSFGDVPPDIAARFRDAGGRPTDFSATDAVVAAAARRGLGVLPVVENPPGWAAADPGNPGSPPSDLAAVSSVFAALVQRYGPEGGFWAEHPELPRLPIRAWQVFNEPNIALHWSIQPFAAAYVATLRAARQGILAVDPGATVVLAGLTNFSWRALARIYAKGGRGLFDAAAVHPYTAEPANVIRIIRYARRVMRRNGDGSLPIWLTEFTWAAAQGRVDHRTLFHTDDRGQAARLREFMPLLLAARKRLRIQRAYWYTWLSREGSEEFDYAGLRRVRDGRRLSAPALRVYRRWARRIEGCAKARADALRCR